MVAHSQDGYKNWLKKRSDKCAKDLDLCYGHVPIDHGICKNYNTSKGNIVAIFRQPEQRVLAGFHYGKFDAPKTQSATAYANAVAGCQVRMLLGMGTEFGCEGKRWLGDVTDKPDLTKWNSSIKKALRRLNEGVAFIGIVEQWALSVCLFHAMFGGNCHWREFQNTRIGDLRVVNKEGNHVAAIANSSSRCWSRVQCGYNISILGGWRDEIDAALYERAVAIFWSNVKLFNVSTTTCRDRICPAFSDEFDDTSLN